MKSVQLPGSAERWPELDGVRGFAALLVVYAHVFLMWMPGAPGWVFWLRTFSGLAWTGVYLFFILSGFLIGGILLENRSAGNFFAVFYTRRALRIFPLYGLLLALFFLLKSVTPLGHGAAFDVTEIPAWSYLLLVQNIPMAMSGSWGAAPLAVTWSVALEEQFYLFLPLLIWLVPARAHLPVFVLLALSGPLFRALTPWSHSWFLMPGASDALFSGTLLAWIFRNRRDLLQRGAGRGVAVAVTVIGAAGMVLAGDRLVVATAATLCWAGFLWLVLSGLNTPWTAVLRSRLLRWVGAISYGTYLFHSFV